MSSNPRHFNLMRAMLIVGLLALLGVISAFAQDSTPEASTASNSTLYVDPTNRFSVKVPPGWTDQSSAEMGIFENGRGITLYLFSLEAHDAEAGIAAAVAKIAPEMTAQSLQVTSYYVRPNGIMTESVYSEKPFERGKVIDVIGQMRNGRVYIELFTAPSRRLLDITAGSDAPKFVTGLTVGLPADLTGHSANLFTSAVKSDFASYIQAEMKRYDITGASVAIIQNGKVVLAQGFGGRTADGVPVDADTLFMVGSITKSMTAMMMGTLVDDKILAWNTPVIKLLPAFKLSDSELASQLHIRHLMSNATGVFPFDLPAYFEKPTPNEMIGWLQQMPIVSRPGIDFIYNNQMIAAAGYAAAAATGTSPSGDGQELYNTYLKLMQQRVFDPIGMSSTTLDFDQVIANDNRATGYIPDIFIKEKLLVAPSFEQISRAFAPALAVWSNADDMARYMQTVMNGGDAPDGRRIISAARLHEIEAPGVPVDDKQKYGMGWFINDYRGLKMLEHGGNMIGFTSDIAFLPDANLGIVVLTNTQSANNFVAAIREYAFELAFDLDHTSGDYYWQLQQSMKDRRFSLVLDTDNFEAVAPTSAQVYLGEYEDHIQVRLDTASKQFVLRTVFGDVPLYASKTNANEFVMGSPLTGMSLEFLQAEDGTIMLKVTGTNLTIPMLFVTYRKID